MPSHLKMRFIPVYTRLKLESAKDIDTGYMGGSLGDAGGLLTNNAPFENLKINERSLQSFIKKTASVIKKIES